jgi:UDP-3-O-[3-hydroxymyristoyl] glucosamine N-acyltransferase
MFVVIANALKDAVERKEGRNRVLISPSASIASSARIGNNCKIGSNVVVGENCVVGDNCEIHDRVTLVQNCRLGRNCVIQSGVTLGEDGFAYERHENSRLEKFPHFKAVIIGDNVEICANTNIARGSLTDTVIGEGTKIDALVHVAHNASVGKNCMLTGGTIIGGSAVIGDSCWTGLNCTVKDHVRIGDNVIVGAGACVIHDVPDGDIVAGVPAKSIRHKVTASGVFLMAGQKKDSVGQIG